jgi:glycine/D-amino acid oxidase-like deaminating enzyme
VPGASVEWRGALYTPSDGRAEPQKAAPAIATAARAHGAKVVTRCAVRGLETSAGRVSGVVTEKGTIACDSVVLAGGAWSRRFCGNLGIHLPQLSVVNSVQRTDSAGGRAGGFGLRRRSSRFANASMGATPSATAICRSPISCRTPLPCSSPSCRRSGSTVPGLATAARPALRRGSQARPALVARPVSPFERVRILDPEPVASILDEALDSLRRIYPAFAAARVAERWAGCIDATPDAVPVISASTVCPA